MERKVSRRVSRMPHGSEYDGVVEALPRDTLFSFLPHELVREVHARGDVAERRQDGDAGCLFVDITGFSDIAYKLTLLTEDATEVLISELNEYFRKIIDVCTEYCGDIVLFSGDAMLVVFSATEMGASAAAQRALLCGWTLLNSSVTEHKFNIRTVTGEELTLSMSLHCGGSYGPISTCIVGGKGAPALGLWKYIVVGDAVQECGFAANLGSAGTLFVTPGLLKVQNELIMASVGHAAEINGTTVNFQFLTAVRQHLADPDGIKIHKSHDLRNAREHARATIPRRLAGMFTFDTLVDQKSGGGQLRTVSTVFIKFASVQHSTPVQQAHAKVHAGVRMLQASLTQLDGVFNKIVMDDKGVLCVCLFGVPKHSHQDDPQRAVVFAMKNAAKLQAKCGATYWGISTAQVFCGTTGSHQRQEYTAIGDGVNLAARLMSQAAEFGPKHGRRAHVMCDYETTMMVGGSLFGHRVTFVDGGFVQLKGRDRESPVFHIVTISERETFVRKQEEQVLGANGGLRGRRRSVESTSDGGWNSPRGARVLGSNNSMQSLKSVSETGSQRDLLMSINSRGSVHSFMGRRSSKAPSVGAQGGLRRAGSNASLSSLRSSHASPRAKHGLKAPLRSRTPSMNPIPSQSPATAHLPMDAPGSGVPRTPSMNSMVSGKNSSYHGVHCEVLDISRLRTLDANALVCRQDEIRAVGAFCDNIARLRRQSPHGAIAGSEGTALAITGKFRVGRSSLLHKAQAMLAARNIDVLYLACDEFSQHTPYAIFKTVLREIINEVDLMDLASSRTTRPLKSPMARRGKRGIGRPRHSQADVHDDADFMTDVRLVSFILRDARIGLPTEEQLAMPEEEIVDTLHRVVFHLIEFSTGVPVVLLVDDAHHIDVGSAALLLFLKSNGCHVMFTQRRDWEESSQDNPVLPASPMPQSMQDSMLSLDPLAQSLGHSKRRSTASDDPPNPNPNDTTMMEIATRSTLSSHHSIPEEDDITTLDESADVEAVAPMLPEKPLPSGVNISFLWKAPARFHQCATSHVTLYPLTKQQHKQLLRHFFFGNFVDPSLADMLYRATLGVPGFVLHIVLHLLDFQMVVLRNAQVSLWDYHSGIPESIVHSVKGVEASVMRVVDGLPGNERAVICLASILQMNGKFERALLVHLTQRLLGVNADGADEVVSKLIATALLLAAVGDPNELYFATQLARDVVYLSQFRSIRKEHHAVVLDAMALPEDQTHITQRTAIHRVHHSVGAARDISFDLAYGAYIEAVHSGAVCDAMDYLQHLWVVDKVTTYQTVMNVMSTIAYTIEMGVFVTDVDEDMNLPAIVLDAENVIREVDCGRLVVSPRHAGQVQTPMGEAAAAFYKREVLVDDAARADTAPDNSPMLQKSADDAEANESGRGKAGGKKKRTRKTAAKGSKKKRSGQRDGKSGRTGEKRGAADSNGSGQPPERGGGVFAKLLACCGGGGAAEADKADDEAKAVAPPDADAEAKREDSYKVTKTGGSSSTPDTSRRSTAVVNMTAETGKNEDSDQKVKEELRRKSLAKQHEITQHTVDYDVPTLQRHVASRVRHLPTGDAAVFLETMLIALQLQMEYRFVQGDMEYLLDACNFFDDLLTQLMALGVSLTPRSPDVNIQKAAWGDIPATVPPLVSRADATDSPFADMLTFAADVRAFMYPEGVSDGSGRTPKSPRPTGDKVVPMLTAQKEDSGSINGLLEKEHDATSIFGVCNMFRGENAIREFMTRRPVLHVDYHMMLHPLPTLYKTPSEPVLEVMFGKERLSNACAHLSLTAMAAILTSDAQLLKRVVEQLRESGSPRWAMIGLHLRLLAGTTLSIDNAKLPAKDMVETESDLTNSEADADEDGKDGGKKKADKKKGNPGGKETRRTGDYIVDPLVLATQSTLSTMHVCVEDLLAHFAMCTPYDALALVSLVDKLAGFWMTTDRFANVPSESPLHTIMHRVPSLTERLEKLSSVFPAFSPFVDLFNATFAAADDDAGRVRHYKAALSRMHEVGLQNSVFAWRVRVHLWIAAAAKNTDSTGINAGEKQDLLETYRTRKFNAQYELSLLHDYRITCIAAPPDGPRSPTQVKSPTTRQPGALAVPTVPEIGISFDAPKVD